MVGRKESVVLCAFLVVLLSVSLVSAGFFGNIFGKVTGNVIDGDIETFSSSYTNGSKVLCEDGDGDLSLEESIYVRAITRRTKMSTGDVFFEGRDYCSGDKTMLLERYCDDSGMWHKYNIICENGCSAGACKELVEEVEENTTGPDQNTTDPGESEPLDDSCDNLFVLEDDGSYYFLDGDNNKWELEFSVREVSFFVDNLESEASGELMTLLNEGESFEHEGKSFIIGSIYYAQKDYRSSSAGVCLPSDFELEDISSKSCSGIKEFVKNPSSFRLDDNEWVLNWNHSWDSENELVSYASFSQSSDYRQSHVNVEVVESSDVGFVKERLEDAIGWGVCQKERIRSSMFSDEDYKVVYLCKDLWNIANDGSDNNIVTAIWVSEDSLFSVYSSNYEYDNCNSYEDCNRREEERHIREQRGVVEFLDKLISNEEEYLGGFYLPWESREFVNLFLVSCGSEIEDDEGYIGSWRCKTEPAICPPHGNQKEICTRWNSQLDEEEVREQTIGCSPGICSGCVVPRWYGGNLGGSNKCIPYGSRLVFESGSSFGIVEEEEGGILSVKEAETNEELDLEVFANGTASITWFNQTFESLSVGDGFEISNVGDFDDDLISVSVAVEEISYAVDDYEESYVLLKLNFVGYDEIIDSYPAYCEIDGQMKGQKSKLSDGEWASCQNNYECESNFCSSGECIEITDMISNVSGFKAIGVKVLCTFANLFGVQDYDSCILESLGEEA